MLFDSSSVRLVIEHALMACLWQNKTIEVIKACATYLQPDNDRRFVSHWADFVDLVLVMRSQSNTTSRIIQ